MPKEKDPTSINEMDEVVNVTLPKADYLIMREMIEKQKSLNWVGKYVRNILFVTAGGVLTLIAFGGEIKKLIATIFNLGP